ncbi:hypothetical protein TVAG_392760 [Trichomonas vaginalis G3]|uniref:Uncharacterized protein n=1 Tax=Trichomonas vaginalis (strain ATCC PRA-98 / G3) TaxID=412133 RepID=A2DWX7_TRIV3|nr:hypothetical protein TVAGG3_0839070 [Trichomonas vaginalis G3]EAY15159.1 hypothetical protein TVAG_392760 [Trichomonas vaginalis G3]KAI5499150.1 hypothetical protein TVAGG3_0839070 [Trichomonas vaginalis G3]|eukprot:XP_001327382.1 hypothetical protein [Trichomonas vaginalis G3]
MSHSNRRYMDIRRTNFPEEVKNLIDEDELKQAVLDEVERNAPKVAGKELHDNASVSEMEDYSGIILTEEEKEEYLLVLEFLDSIGLKYAPAVLRYESQHPEIEANRKELADRLDLNARSQDPLLVQLFQERLNELKK